MTEIIPLSAPLTSLFIFHLWPCCPRSHTLTSSLCAVLATLWVELHPASHQRILPNTRRTTFINVMGLLPTVHFFLWVPRVHFSCSPCSSSSSRAGYLVRPVPLQQSTHSISFKVLYLKFLLMCTVSKILFVLISVSVCGYSVNVILALALNNGFVLQPMKTKRTL